LEISFHKWGHLEDANSAHYHRKRAELEAARQQQNLLTRWPVELEWWAWGALSGYGTKFSWVLGWSVLLMVTFAALYMRFGDIRRQPWPKAHHDFSIRLRLWEDPRDYLGDSPSSRLPNARLQSFVNALRLSTVVLFKVGHRDTQLASRSGGSLLKWLVIVEWLIGFYVIGVLLVTLTNTQPLLQSVLSKVF
jgi:hypothetical protein